MSTRAQQAQLLDNVTFQQQVKGSLLAAASNVLNEGADAPNHAKRLLWANAIYVNPQQQMFMFLPGMLSNATVSANAGSPVGASGTPIPDSDVDYVVASLFDTYSNQYASQHITGAALLLGT